jgi:hypothetical protein
METRLLFLFFPKLILHNFSSRPQVGTDLDDTRSDTSKEIHAGVVSRDDGSLLNKKRSGSDPCSSAVDSEYSPPHTLDATWRLDEVEEDDH